MKAIYDEITKRVERYLCKEYKVKLNYSDGESYLYITDKSGKVKISFLIKKSTLKKLGEAKLLKCLNFTFIYQI